jgi:hypothetical protein
MAKINLDEVPFEQIQKLGITRQMLEQTGNLEKLLNGEKTDLIQDFKVIHDGVEKRFSAHLVLEPDETGKPLFRIRAPEIKEVIKQAKPEEISLDKIPFKQLAPLGMSREILQDSGELEKLLKGEKTSIIPNLTMVILGKERRATGRLFLIIEPDGKLKFRVEFVKANQAMHQS